MRETAIWAKRQCGRKTKDRHRVRRIISDEAGAKMRKLVEGEGA